MTLCVPFNKMGQHSDGEEHSDKKKRKYANTKDVSNSFEEDKYKIYFKTNYTRLFLENDSANYTVYVESKEKEKLGNKNPIKLTGLLNENVKGITCVSRINAYKIGVNFQKAADANSFIKLDNFLSKHKFRAFIPAHLVEKVGVIKFVPTDLSNEDIYKNISSDAEIISIKRFMKRNADKKLMPMSSVAITFSTTTLPRYVYLNLFRCEVQTYISPLIQCFKCFKFNHSAKVCRSKQMCSYCAGDHHYKECVSDILVCINCGGGHLAVSRDCPIKRKKIELKRADISKQNSTFASVANNDKNFPPLKTKEKPIVNNNSNSFNKKDNIIMNKEQIANNDIILNAIVRSLVTLANSSNDDNITINKIKEIFLKNLV